MIIEVHKYLIYGNIQEMERFFVHAQNAGFLEFTGGGTSRAVELPAEAKVLLAAMKIAKQHPVHRKEAPLEPQEPLEVAKLLVARKEEYERLWEEERLLRIEMARVAPFGDFSRSDLDLLEQEARRVIQFFCMKSDLAREAVIPPEVIHIATEYDLDYFIAIHKERTQYPQMIEVLVERPIRELKQRLFEVQGQLQKVENDLKAYANDLPLLQEGLVLFMNQHHFVQAKAQAQTALDGALFVVEAWVPKTRVEDLQRLMTKLSVECEPIAVESRDSVPTCFENKGASKIGESLVIVYDTPAHTDRDPSLWVLIFFAIFFSMILSDAGYGLILGLIALFLRRKFPRMQGVARRVLHLLFVLSGGCILWGIATASYFAVDLSPTNPLKKSSLVYYLLSKKAEYHWQNQDDVYEEYLKDFPEAASAKTSQEFLLSAVKEKEGKLSYAAVDEFADNLLMEFSFLIGMVHLSLSFLRYMRRNWAGLGWILFIFGGYFYFPSVIHATTLVNFMGWISKPTAEALGLPMIGCGIVIAFVSAWVKRRWGAFQELTNAVQVFADVLSYLRLYALALGGMVMAQTFNDHLGIDLGIVGALFIIVFGHLINLSLSVMGGIVHGLRLNFLEWYHYSFDGGGRLFNPLRLIRTKSEK